MLAPSQEENTNPNETRFVSHSDVSLAYTLTVVRGPRLGGSRNDSAASVLLRIIDPPFLSSRNCPLRGEVVAWQQHLRAA